jgi:two-component system response regulator YesN
MAVLDHIHHHYAEPLPLDRAARIAGYHPDHFSKLFKQRQGMTFEHYLRAFRIEQAKRLLGDTDLAVARIAELSGFHSAGYFCRAFRQVTGTTPMRHRRRRRKRKPSGTD